MAKKFWHVLGFQKGQKHPKNDLSAPFLTHRNFAQFDQKYTVFHLVSWQFDFFSSKCQTHDVI